MEDAHDAVSVLRRRPARGERDGRTGGDDTENQTSHLASLPFAVGCGSQNFPGAALFQTGGPQRLRKVWPDRPGLLRREDRPLAPPRTFYAQAPAYPLPPA